MIIRDNFDKKRALPNDNNYEKIGKGSMNIDKQLEEKKKVKFVWEIDENKDRENDEEEIRDKWDFFK